MYRTGGRVEGNVWFVGSRICTDGPRKTSEKKHTKHCICRKLKNIFALGMYFNVFHMMVSQDNNLTAVGHLHIKNILTNPTVHKSTIKWTN